jgi:hypothetical protein
MAVRRPASGLFGRRPHGCLLSGLLVVRHGACKVMVEKTEDTMTLTLTPSLTIRIRRAADNASRVIHTHTRRLSITSLSFLKMEVMVFKYHGK